MTPNEKDSGGRLATLEALYATFVLPMFCVWPILYALKHWRTWESIAWLVGVAIGAFCYFRNRDRERRRRSEAE